MERMINLIATVLFVALFCGLFGGACYAYPQWRVWQRELAGKATLREAEWDRKVAVEEAQAKLASAKHLAAAEVERARGVAQANEIIGESLRNNEAYLRWLWIENLSNGEGQVLYIPTEAGIPILEAGKRQ